jgi:hypothetical protein
MALASGFFPDYHGCLGEGGTYLGHSGFSPAPSPRHKGPTVNESFRRRDLRFQDAAAALLRLDSADRQRFIPPLIELLMHVTSEGSGPTSAPSTPANGHLHPRA